MLAAVATLVGAGLDGQWDETQARALGELIEGREDIGFDDVRTITSTAVEDVGSSSELSLPDRAKLLVGKISTGAISGAFGTGIVAALSQLF